MTWASRGREWSSSWRASSAIRWLASCLGRGVVAGFCRFCGGPGRETFDFLQRPLRLIKLMDLLLGRTASTPAGGEGYGAALTQAVLEIGRGLGSGDHQSGGPKARLQFPGSTRSS